MSGGDSFNIRRWLMIIVAAALVIRLFFVIFILDPIPEPYEIDLDEVDFDYLGMKFASGEGLTDKYGEPTTVRFPLYAVFLGGLYFIFGYHPYMVFILQALMGALVPVIVFLIALELSDRRISLFTAAIAAVYPSYIVLTGHILSENLFLPLLALLMWFTLRLRRDFNPLNAGLTGLLVGLCALTRGAATPLIMIAPLAVLIFWKSGFPQRLKRAVLMAAVTLLTIAPWVARNYHHYQRIFLTSSSGGIVLWMSYNWVSTADFFNIDRAYAYVDSAGRGNADLRVFNRILVEDNIFGKAGTIEGFKRVFPEKEFPDNEVDLNRAVIEMVKSDFKERPEIFVVKTIKEFLRFWHFLDDRGNYVTAYGLILPFFLAGLWLLRRRMREYGLLLLFFVYTWMLETGFMASARFRMPFEVVMIVVGAYALSRMFSRLKPAVVPAGIIAALLAVNLYFTYNVSILRNCIRSAAAQVGLPVAQEDEEFFPQIRDNVSGVDSLNSGQESDSLEIPY